MSDMECPFCQQTIVCMDAKKADEYAIWFCPRCVAERNWYGFGNKALWQELICIRKALNMAIDTLHWYNDNYDSIVAQNTLDEIKTALEQKDKQ